MMLIMGLEFVESSTIVHNYEKVCFTSNKNDAKLATF